MSGEKYPEQKGHDAVVDVATVEIDVAGFDAMDHMDDDLAEVGDGEAELVYEVADPSRPSAARDIYVAELANAAKHEDAKRFSGLKVDADRVLFFVTRGQGKIDELPKMLVAAQRIQESVETVLNKRLATGEKGSRAGIGDE